MKRGKLSAGYLFYNLPFECLTISYCCTHFGFFPFQSDNLYQDKTYFLHGPFLPPLGCDLPDTDINKVKADLLNHEIILEDFQGDVQAVEVSAQTGQGLEALTECILLQAEMLDLKANPNRPAHGVVIESTMEKGFGPVATVLIQAGTIRGGDIVVAGSTFGRVRSMKDDTGMVLKEAGPSMPVKISGLENTPNASDEIDVVEDDKTARSVVQYRQQQIKLRKQAQRRSMLADLVEKIGSEETKELPVIIKADLHGSAEAIAQSLTQLSTEKYK